MTMPGAPKLRTFVGLPLPESNRELLAVHLDACRAVAPALNWVSPANLHLTLRFLGHVELPTLDRVRAGLRRLQANPFTLALGGRGRFGARAAPRVVWLSVAGGAADCAGLAERIESICRAAGLAPDERTFRAHVTLARARGRGPVSVPALPEPPSLEPWRADRFVLYESRLGRAGATYVPMEEFPLRA